jgi:hypothetical protein
MNEYNKLKQHLKTFQEQTGTLYDVAIILSKCEQAEKGENIKSEEPEENDAYPDEIVDPDEDTDIYDLVKQVKNKFPEDEIVLFNAYGRSYYSKKSSTQFKSCAQKQCGNPTKNNIQFNITKFYKNFVDRQDNERYNFLNRKFHEFMNNKISIDEIYNSFVKVNETFKIEFIKKLIKADIIYKNYEFLIKIYNTCISICKTFMDDFLTYLFKCNFDMINKEQYQFNNNYDSIKKFNKEIFEQFTFELKEKIVDDMIFRGKIAHKIDVRKDFLIII